MVVLTKAGLTEEEEEYYDELDEFFTQNTIMPSGTGKGGFFAKRKEVVDTLGVDGLVADYLAGKMLSTKQPLPVIIRNLVKKEMAMA